MDAGQFENLACVRQGFHSVNPIRKEQVVASLFTHSDFR